KYVLLLLRADNAGEGGTLSLMALGQRALGRRSWFLLALGVIGASMFLGDSMITPAIWVLSAVEGLKLAAPALEHYVVPLTVLILVALFAVQSRGTAMVASVLGPVMVVWSPTLGVLGLVHFADDPSMVPNGLLLPMVALSTAATVIASQAVITGAYSLTRQAIQLVLLPRFEVRFTSETHVGQIYLPRVNTLLLIGVMFLVLMFRTSG